MSNNSTDPPNLYPILLESHKQGVWDGRQIVVGPDPTTIFDEFSVHVLSDGQLVYESDMFRTTHSDLAELFSGLVDGYPIPDGDDECLSGEDVFPGLQFLLKSEKRKIEQGLVELVDECDSFLERSLMAGVRRILYGGYSSVRVQRDANPFHCTSMAMGSSIWRWRTGKTPTVDAHEKWR